jgi:hypothetical protein
MILLARHILIDKLWSELEQDIMIRKPYPLNEWVYDLLLDLGFITNIMCVLFLIVLLTIYL